MNILTADLIRVMRNVSVHCDNEERRKHVQEYVHRMQYSGYDQSDRVAVYKKAKRCFDNIVQESENGGKPVYRSKTYQRAMREKERNNKRRNWYGKGGDETVMFVDATPGSALAKKFTGVLRTCGLNIRVVERTGETVKSLLTKSDPFRTKTCNTTSRSIGQRYAEHCSQHVNRTSASVFAPHFKVKHGSSPQELELKILKTCPGDAMLWQVTEAVHIAIEKPSLNTKQEWRRRVMNDVATDVNVS